MQGGSGSVLAEVELLRSAPAPPHMSALKVRIIHPTFQGKSVLILLTMNDFLRTKPSIKLRKVS